MGEDHEVVFVVAEDMESARRAAKAKWGGDGRPHVDALTRLDMIDGYAVGLEHGRRPATPRETEGYNAVSPQTAGDSPPSRLIAVPVRYEARAESRKQPEVGELRRRARTGRAGCRRPAAKRS